MLQPRDEWDYLDSQVLIGAMEKLIEEAHRLREVNERYGPHASSLIAAWRPFCLRECVLAHQYIPTPVELEARQINIFASGTATHERWQDVFRRTKVAIEIEVQHIYPGPGLRFTPDSIIILLTRTLGIIDPCVVELKGYHHDEYLRLIDDPYPPYDAYRQAQLYMHCLGLKKCLVIVEDKDTQAFWVWVGDYDPTCIADLIERMDLLQEASLAFRDDERILPERICESARDEPARKCSQRIACFASWEKRRRMMLPEDERFKGVSYVKGPHREPPQVLCDEGSTHR